MLAKPVYTAPGLSFLPGFLTPDFSVRRSTARDSLDEIIVAELGDATFKAPFMIVRTSNNDLAVYSPYHDSTHDRNDASLQFLKLPCPFMPEAPRVALVDEPEKQANERLLAIPDFCGFSAVVLTGSTPHFILKTSTSNPQVISARGQNMLDLSALHLPFCPRGVAQLDIQVSMLSDGPINAHCDRVAYRCREWRPVPTWSRAGQSRKSSNDTGSARLRITKGATASSFLRRVRTASSSRRMTTIPSGTMKASSTMDQGMAMLSLNQISPCYPMESKIKSNS